MSLLSLIVGIPVLIYLLLWLSPVRERLRTEAERQLSGLLDATVSIGELDVEPFTRLVLSDAGVAVGTADTVLTFNRLTAGFSLRDLLMRQRIVITDVVLIEPEISLRRDSVGAPLNVEPIMSALKGDGRKPPVDFDLAVNTVVIRGGKFNYDVLDRPLKVDATDFNHIRLRGMNADVNAPRISRDSVSVRLRRLQFNEGGGLILSRLSGDVIYTPERLSIDGLTLRLPKSLLRFDRIDLALRESRVGEVALQDGSRINLDDLASLMPFDVSVINDPLELSGRVELFTDSVQLRQVNLRVGDMLAVSASGNKREQMLESLSLSSSGAEIGRIAGSFTKLPARSDKILTALGDIEIVGSASRSKHGTMKLDAEIESALGYVAAKGELVNKRLVGSLKSEGLDLRALLPDKELGEATFNADFDLSRTGGNADVAIESLSWRGHDYRDIDTRLEYRGKSLYATVNVNDSLVAGEISAQADLTPGDMACNVDMIVNNLRPDAMGLWNAHPGFSLSGRLSGAFTGPELTQPSGFLQIDSLQFANAATGEKFVDKPLRLSTDFQSAEQRIDLTSGPLDFTAGGRINVKTLAGTMKRIASAAFPQLFVGQSVEDNVAKNDFRFEGTIHEQSALFDLVSLPVRPLYDADIRGEILESKDSASVSLRVPYLQQGKRLIRDAEVALQAGARGSLSVKAETDNKRGRPMRFTLNSELEGGCANSSLGWIVESDRRFDGRLGFDIKPLPSGADVQIRESEMIFNDAIWTVNPAYAGVRAGSVIVGNLVVDGPGQQAVIRGVASADSVDVLVVKLDNIDLDYLFDTLALGPQITFGGAATGTVTGRAVLSPEAILQTNDLYVRDFSYNHCVFGNAELRAAWDSASRGIVIGGDISGLGDTFARVDGVIYPLSQKLDLDFDAKKLPAGFIQPFLASWADEVGGYASGHARLFGDFVMVDLEGDLFADDF